LVLGIDSSLLRSEGTPADIPKYRDWLTYVIPIRLYGTAASVDMIMFGSGEQRKSQLRRFIQQLNPPSPPPGYVPNDPQVPVVRHGPYQYINFDLEALSQFACADKIERDGTYKGRPADNTVRNRETGATDALKCDALRGVLDWNAHRNLQLPQAAANFCSSTNDCPEFAVLAKDPKIMMGSDGRPDLDKIFIDPGSPTSERVINSNAIF
jgi:hypothetical protein